MGRVSFFCPGFLPGVAEDRALCVQGEIANGPPFEFHIAELLLDQARTYRTPDATRQVATELRGTATALDAHADATTQVARQLRVLANDLDAQAHHGWGDT